MRVHSPQKQETVKIETPAFDAVHELYYDGHTLVQLHRFLLRVRAVELDLGLRKKLLQLGERRRRQDIEITHITHGAMRSADRCRVRESAHGHHGAGPGAARDAKLRVPTNDANP